MKKGIGFISAVSFLFCLNANASLTLSADRLVYNAKSDEASVTIHNSESRGYLIQSWLDTGDSTKKTGNIPFVVTPPLFKLAPGTDNLIRIVYLGSGLPADRENLLWLDVKGIPGLNEEESKASSRMVVAINNRIKFFYRPANLKGEPGEAAKNLTWSNEGQVVSVTNNSPYYAVLSKIVVDKEAIPVSVDTNNTVIPPFGKKTYKLKHSLPQISDVEWQSINDFGLESKPYKYSMH